MRAWHPPLDALTRTRQVWLRANQLCPQMSTTRPVLLASVPPPLRTYVGVLLASVLPPPCVLTLICLCCWLPCVPVPPSMSPVPCPVSSDWVEKGLFTEALPYLRRALELLVAEQRPTPRGVCAHPLT